jgi:SAM-dependent methyltransferase
MATTARTFVEMSAELWSVRAHDWAETQDTELRQDFAEGVRRTGIGPATAVLDLGCGAGGFARAAAAAGAAVTGIDVAAGMIEMARARVPGGRFDVGDMQSLPYADDSFDVIAAFHSLQLAPDPSRVLAEVRRVGKPGARLLVAIWGRDERNELGRIVKAVQAVTHHVPPPGSPGVFALTGPGELKALVEGCGLVGVEEGDVEMHYEYPDAATLVRAIRSAGPTILVEQAAGVDAVERAILSAAAPYRTTECGYRLEIEWTCVSGQLP